MAVREMRDVTQADLAAAVGVSAATVSRWEADLAEPTTASLARLAAVLGVTRSYLAFGEGPKTPEPPIDAGMSADDLRRIAGKPAAGKRRPNSA